MGIRNDLVLGLAAALVLGVAGMARADTPADGVHTLTDALAAAYANNPTLQAARAQLRSVDENVPTALAGWRPQVNASANGGYMDAGVITHYPSLGYNAKAKALRGVNTEGLTVTQPLWRGGQTRASTNQAENKVMAQRASLMGTEETVFTNVINAFVSVIAYQQVLALDVNNERVLTRQLQATNDRFRVGEITRTDVAQAEAALAGATATRQTAEGSLQTARAQFQQYVGVMPGQLASPQPLKLPTRTIEEAKTMASTNNPSVVSALFNDAAAKDNFDLQYAKLMPNISLVGTVSRIEDASTVNVTTSYSEIVAQLTVPIYQGGSEYAAIRQARQLQQQARKQLYDARNTAVEQAISSWETYAAAHSTIDSTRAQIRSNQVALEGVQREAIVGSRTTLDVLNAEQTLLNSQVTLVQNLASLVTASYSVASAVGRLTAHDLALPVPYYDETAYYKAVKNKWIGTGDAATDQPGR